MAQPPLLRLAGRSIRQLLSLGGNPLKRVLAMAALVLGTAAAFAIPASASTACLEVHVNVNGTPVDQVQCV